MFGELTRYGDELDNEPETPMNWADPQFSLGVLFCQHKTKHPTPLPLPTLAWFQAAVVTSTTTTWTCCVCAYGHHSTDQLAPVQKHQYVCVHLPVSWAVGTYGNTAGPSSRNNLVLLLLYRHLPVSWAAESLRMVKVAWREYSEAMQTGGGGISSPWHKPPKGTASWFIFSRVLVNIQGYSLTVMDISFFGPCPSLELTNNNLFNLRCLLPGLSKHRLLTNGWIVSWRADWWIELTASGLTAWLHDTNYSVIFIQEHEFGNTILTPKIAAWKS